MSPSHASATREDGGEALTGGVQAWLLSSEITPSGLPTLWSDGEGHTLHRVIREWCSGPAESKNHGMYTSLLHGNREIPGVSGRVPRSVRSGKAIGRNLDMYASGKSDTGIVSEKRMNKGAQPVESGQPPAESVEKSPVAKGNSGQTTVHDTQGSPTTSSGLARIREAASRDSQLQFTNLLHHVTASLLGRAYWSLKRQAAAGVDGETWTEYGEWSKTVVGTPQGAVISPLLANIYLHYVLDLWVSWWRCHQARGEVYIVRYADDFVVGFQYRSDAERFQKELRQRLTKFSLELHEGKTRLIEFGRFASENRKERGEGKPETFDFLGFTHICAKRRKDGGFALGRKTIAKRLRAKIREVKESLKRNRHRPIPEQGGWLRSVVQGHFKYYGVPGNRKALDAFRTQIGRDWLRALRRRSQKGVNLTWSRFQKWMKTWIPTARVMHPYPNQRLCV